MAENTTTIRATPEDVFDVLLDPWTYVDWVVGCDAIRGVDREWPAVGSRFHHTVGAGPAKTHDSTTLVAVDAPARLVLDASVGRAGVARVIFTVERDGTASRVTVNEEPIAGPAEKLPAAVTEPSLKLRNAETLRRLRHVVEDRVAARR